MNNKRYRLTSLFLTLVAAVAFSGSIKVWGPGERLTSKELNDNFAHIHNTMVGGHGGRLVDSDIAVNANININKFKNDGGLQTVYDGGNTYFPVRGKICGPMNSSVTPVAVTTSGDGISSGVSFSNKYRVYFSSNRPNANYGVIGSSYYDGAEVCGNTDSHNVAYIEFACQKVDPLLGGANTDGCFNFLVIDDDP